MEETSSSDHSCSLRLIDLPEELIVTVASHLPPTDLLKLIRADHRLNALPVDALWRNLCSEAWKRWPRYALTEERERWLSQHMPGSWVDRYRLIGRDMARTAVTTAELEEGEWWFNFTPLAGGLGERTLQRARFLEGKVHLAGYPPLPFTLEAETMEGDDSLLSRHMGMPAILNLLRCVGLQKEKPSASLLSPWPPCAHTISLRPLVPTW